MRNKYEDWFRMDYWSLDEAALLFIGMNPLDTASVEALDNLYFRVKYGFNRDRCEALSISFKKMHLELSRFKFEESAYQSRNANIIKVTALLDKVIEKDIQIHRPLLDYWHSLSAQHHQEPNTNAPYSSFKQLKSLRYDEIIITFLAGDAIELSARDITKTFTYQSLGLRDMRKKDEATLNKSGLFLAKFLSKTTPKPDEKDSKHKDKLKRLINSWFGLDRDPFNVVGTAPSSRYEPKFLIKSDFNRAADRVKNRTKHVSLENFEGTAAFSDENDEAGEFIRNNE